MSNTLFGNHERTQSAQLQVPISDYTQSISIMSSSSIDVKDIKIYNELDDYEASLNKLVKSVDSFKPDLAAVNELIENDRKVYATLDTFNKYDEISTKINELNKKNEVVNGKKNDILNILNECNELLNKLPMVQEIEFEKKTMLDQREKINSMVLLNYATKLSKFTKIPPTFDKNSLGPSNFIWPGEDSLRKGMMALASLHEKELTAYPGSTDESNDEVITEQVEEDTGVPDANQTSIEERERRTSFTFGIESNNTAVVADNRPGVEKSETHNEEENIDLDLDLFDPDDF